MYENYSYSIIYLSHHASEWHDNGFFFKVLMIDLCVEANGTWIPLFFDRCFFHWKVYEERSKDCDRTWKWNFQRWGRLTASHSGDISTHLNSIFYVIRILDIRFWPFKLEINSMWFWLFHHQNPGKSQKQSNFWVWLSPAFSWLDDLSQIRNALRINLESLGDA